MTAHRPAFDRANDSPRQASLFGFEADAQPQDRLFFALFPDPAAAARIERLAADLRTRHRLRGKPLRTDRFHVTLHHLGDHAGLPAALVQAASAVAATVPAAPFDIVFDRVATFSRRSTNKPVILRGGDDGLAALTAFQRRLGAALQDAGLGRWVDLRFTPHLTLMYDDRGLPEAPVEPIRWTAREFVLVHSLIGKTEHRHLARWPLREKAHA